MHVQALPLSPMSTPGRCHFDSSGWLQGPVSITHVMTPNRYDSGFAAHARGLVFHTEQGFEAGTVATFLSRASQASAFFSIAQSGACHQYLPVGHGYVAWAEAGGNPDHYSIEDEDGTHPSVPLTAAQITTFAQILEACSARDGFPLQITDDVNGQGLILHSDGGAAWGGHFSCPGPVRAAQRPQIIALAMAIRSGGATPATDWTEAIMAELPTLKQGSADKAGQVLYVHRLQVLVAGIGAWNKLGAVTRISADGTFGPATTAAVKAVQKFFGIAQDGIAGPVTWRKLVTGS